MTSIRILSPEVRRIFVVSAVGAKARVARLGAHPLGSPRRGRGGSAAAPGPLTRASAPKAPGRLGREDARNSGGGTLFSSLRGWADVILHTLLGRIARDDEDYVDVSIVDDDVRRAGRHEEEVTGLNDQRVVQVDAGQHAAVTCRDVDRGLAVGVDVRRAAQTWRQATQDCEDGCRSHRLATDRCRPGHRPGPLAGGQPVMRYQPNL